MSQVIKPFRVHRRDGVVTLVLDTPGCQVNIFDHNATEQLREILDELDPEVTRALVLKSGKVRSFVNGAKLMMALSVNSADEAGEMTSGVRAAYQALRSCPVPTFAAIAGSCFGCGVELTLCCDHRIVADTALVQFYMTEIADYLLVPIFESTARLPLLLGLDGAARFLLWGERWGPREALDNGLVDRVLDVDQFDSEVDAFVVETLARHGGRKPAPRPSPDQRPSAPPLDGVVARHQHRIDSLPPDYQPVYGEGLRLMARVARRGSVTPEDLREEIAASGRTSCDPKAKQALSFFFVRQVATSLCLGRAAAEDVPLRVGFSGSGGDLQRLRSTLEARRLPGVSVASDARPPVGEGALVVLRDHGPVSSNGNGRLDVGVALGLGAPLSWTAATMLHGPSFPPERPLLEVALRDSADAKTRLFCDYLSRVGFNVVVTRPRERFAIDEMVAAYFAPLVRYCWLGGHVEDVNLTLRGFGFARRPHDLLAGIGSAAVGSVLAAAGMPGSETADALQRLLTPDYEGGRCDTRVLDGLCASLLAAASRCRAAGTLAHPSLSDLIARETLDFPLQHGSLGMYGTKARLRVLMGQASEIGDLVGAMAMAEIAEMSASGKGAYL